ncbi:MAG TPA: hypothetical protein VHJ20_03495 [Polyangia bacterium]|nr:hypothetical protein [Polyangia bacterium]
MAGDGKRVGRKLLVASLGVATVSFVACGKSTPLAADASADHADDADDDSNADAGQPQDGPPEGVFDAAIDRQFTGNIIP